jgi:signal peptidase I
MNKFWAWIKSQRENLQTILIAVLLAFFIRTFVAEARYIPSESMLPTLIGSQDPWQSDRIIVEKLTYDFSKPQRTNVIVFVPPACFQDNAGSASVTDTSVAYIKRIIGLPGDRVEVQGGKVRLGSTVLDHERFRVQLFERTAGLSSEFNGFTERPLAYQKRLKLEKDGVQFGDKKLSTAEIAQKFGLTPDQVAITPGVVLINNKALDESYTYEDPSYNMKDLRDIPCYQGQKTGPVIVPEGHYFAMGDNRNNSQDSHIWGFLPAHACPKEQSVVDSVLANTGIAPCTGLIGKAAFRFFPLNRLGTI